MGSCFSKSENSTKNYYCSLDEKHCTERMIAGCDIGKKKTYIVRVLDKALPTIPEE